MVSSFHTNTKCCLQTQQNIKGHLLVRWSETVAGLDRHFLRKIRFGMLHRITFSPSWVLLSLHSGASRRGCFLPGKVRWLLQWHRCAFSVVQLVSCNIYSYCHIQEFRVYVTPRIYSVVYFPCLTV